MKIAHSIAGFVFLAGALALAEDAPPAVPAPGKRPHRPWQDVPQPPLDKIATPKPVVATLANGIKVYLIEDHELPTIDVQLIVRAGEIDLASLYAEPRAKAGLHSLAGQVMRTGGTTSKTGDELDEMLDDMAASVETSVGFDQGHARLSCLAESFDQTLAIFADVVRRPAFRDEKVALAKKQRLGSLRRRNENPSQIASREFARILFGDTHPLGWTEEPATIASITRDDIVRFYESSFAASPGTALMGAVGDFDAAKMKEKLEKAFGDWTAKKDAAPKRVAVRTNGFESPDPKVFFVQKTDVNQSTVILGHMGIQRTPGDADYPAAVVANTILGGGGFAARLMQKIRTEMGLAYGVRSALDASFGRQGTFVLSGQTKSGSTLAMARQMRKELERLVAEPPSAEELRVAKESILQGIVFSFERKSEVLDRALRNELYGFPQNELEVFQAGIATVTADDVVRVAKKLFRPDRLTTMIVGNDAELDGKVAELGEVTMIDVGKPAGRERPGRGASTETGTDRNRDER